MLYVHWCYSTSCFLFVLFLLFCCCFLKEVYYHSQPKIMLLLESGALPDSQIKAILIHRTAAETEESASHVVLLKLQFAHVAWMRRVQVITKLRFWKEHSCEDTVSGCECAEQAERCVRAKNKLNFMWELFEESFRFHISSTYVGLKLRVCLLVVDGYTWFIGLVNCSSIMYASRRAQQGKRW